MRLVDLVIQRLAKIMVRSERVWTQANQVAILRSDVKNMFGSDDSYACNNLLAYLRSGFSKEYGFQLADGFSEASIYINLYDLRGK